MALEASGPVKSEHLEALLMSVFRDVRKLFNYISTFSPSDVDTKQVTAKDLARYPLPKEIGYEFCSTISHLLVIKKIHTIDSQAACDEAVKAGRHITRALLDYMKYHAIRGTGVVHPIISTGKIIQARREECAGIGTNHNGAMATYQELLELHYQKKVPPVNVKIQQVKMELDGSVAEALEQFFRLEVVFSGLTCEKFNEVLSSFLRIFTLNQDPLPHLIALNQYLATRILDELLARFSEYIHSRSHSSEGMAKWVARFREFRAASDKESNSTVIDMCESLMDIIVESANAMLTA